MYRMYEGYVHKYEQKVYVKRYYEDYYAKRSRKMNTQTIIATSSKLIALNESNDQLHVQIVSSYYRHSARSRTSFH